MDESGEGSSPLKYPKMGYLVADLPEFEHRTSVSVIRKAEAMRLKVQRAVRLRERDVTGYLDIETSHLKADFGVCYSWVIKEAETSRYDQALITREELISPVQDRRVELILGGFTTTALGVRSASYVAASNSATRNRAPRSQHDRRIQRQPMTMKQPPACPECGSTRVWRDALRKTGQGPVQRYLCRDCGSRFSQETGFKHLNSASRTNTRRIGADETKAAKNSAPVRSVTRQDARTTGQRGATEDVKELLFNYAWWLKKQGYADLTIKSRVELLRILAKRGADLHDPESVKENIAKQKWCNKRKNNAADAYTAFLKMAGGSWKPPKYRVVEKLPFIPMEEELDALIAGCGPVTSTFLQLLKETAMRAGEADKLKWTDVDFKRRTLRATPEKGSKPRIFKLSNKLIDMLSAQRRRSNTEKVFTGKRKHRRQNFQKQRATLARKLQNPGLRQIKFHTFRHWKATMLYHQTKDIVYVQQFLGHRNINNTLKYIQLEKTIFAHADDDYISKVAENIDEAAVLIEAGFD